MLEIICGDRHKTQWDFADHDCVMSSISSDNFNGEYKQEVGSLSETDRLRAELQGLNLYLIGMMGSGKTTVGQQLAQRLGYQFFDTDAVVEQVAGQSIQDLFAELGEAGFRDLESRVLSELCAYTQLAIATGGGIVTRQENWSYLRHGVIVWLDVPLAQLVTRLQADTRRPLLQQGDLPTRLADLLNQRRSLYAQADVQISYQADESPEQLAVRILQQVQGIIKTPNSPPAQGNGARELPGEWERGSLE
ncbi:MAG: shikimate kinase [Leptolyngbyaceae cyanobacterium bins.349]|nr:shikimate kinase [Leptolyngbyaceae cyanobacterium bins.349]